MWKKAEDEYPTSSSVPASTLASNPRPASPEPRRASSTPAIIGESIRVQGEIHGDEDLLIEGEVDGSVHLEKHSVTIGRSGRVKADVHGRNLVVEGKVQGDLFADEQVVVRASGEVRGNITSPRVSLEDGSKFKGSIDMEPRGGRPAAEQGGALRLVRQAERRRRRRVRFERHRVERHRLGRPGPGGSGSGGYRLGRHRLEAPPARAAAARTPRRSAPALESL